MYTNKERKLTMNMQEEARREALRQEFGWLNGYIDLELSEYVLIMKVDRDILNRQPYSCNEVEREIIYILDGYGGILEKVGELRPKIYDPKFRSWMFWKWSTCLPTPVKECVEDTLFRMQFGKSRYILRLDMVMREVKYCGIKLVAKSACIYKCPTEFTIKEWAARLRQQEADAVELKINQNKIFAEDRLRREISIAERLDKPKTARRRRQ